MTQRLVATRTIRQTDVPILPASWVTNTHSDKNVVSADITFRRKFP